MEKNKISNLPSSNPRIVVSHAGGAPTIAGLTRHPHGFVPVPPSMQESALTTTVDCRLHAAAFRTDHRRRSAAI